MKKTILIVYYSESGSTKEIAEEISRTIVCEKIKNLPISEVKEINYDTIIIGTPNWYGKPTPEVLKFIRKNEKTLMEKNVHLYFSCMDCYYTSKEKTNIKWFYDSHFINQKIVSTKLSSWEKSHITETYLENLNKISNKLNIKSIAFFKGRLDFKRVSFLHALVMRFICMINKKIKQGNYLNKSDVATWSNTIFNS